MTVGNRIFLQRELPEKNIIEEFRKIPTANIADTMNRLCALNYDIHLISRPNKQMCGSALTVKVRPGDNLMIHAALDIAQPGDILIVSNEGDRTQSLMGEIMMEYACHFKKIGGIVLDGPIRDVDQLSQMDFPIYAAGSTPGGPFKEGPGEVNVPIAIAGVAVNPGDIVVGDADGVIVIPRKDAEMIASNARKLSASDAEKVAAAKEGKNSRQWVQDTLKKKNTLIIDGKYYE